MKAAGVREDAPTTLVGATGIVDDFKGYVDKTYRRIQVTDHGSSWFFRQSLDQTLAISASTDEYAMPSGLQELNWRTVTIYLTAKTDETPVTYKDYYEWRTSDDTRTIGEARPQYITMRPDDVLQIFPVPEQAYTLRFDGVLEVDSMSSDTDIPILPTNAHWAIVWGAVKRFAAAHEDGTKLAEAEEEYRPLFDTLVERQLPETKVVTGQLYGMRVRDTRRGY
jgi:hypothetical protein